MTRILYAAIAAACLAQPAFAAMDCGNMLDKHTGMIVKMTAATPEKRAAMQRMALRGYDHCMAGDEVNAKMFWDMISTAAAK